jgi:hypothetical protein
MSPLVFSLVGITVLITHALEAITGFGCTVLALPFVTALVGVKIGVPILATLAWILALYIVITKWKHINFKEFAIIVFFVGLGLPFGMLAFKNLDSRILKKILALFITLSAAWQIYRRFTKPNRDNANCPAAPVPAMTESLRSRLPYYLLLILGGMVHGAFASGGPLVVLYASKALQDKGSFRATLCLLWTSLNTILLVNYLRSGVFTAPIIQGTAGMLPFLVAGIIVGEKIHHQVDGELFGKLIFLVLFATGLFMLFL